MPDRPSTDLSTPVKFGDVAHEPDRLSVDGWQKMRFGELAFHISDRVDDPKTAGVTTYVGLDHLDPGSLKIKRRGTPDDVNATKLRVKPGQIIFGKRRAYQRKVAVADFDGICSAHAMVLEANPETTAPGFLPFFMQSDLFFDRALAISEGSLSPTIKWKTLAAQEFLIPPIARQKELMELFQAIEDAIAATEESISAAEELKRSLMSELLIKGIGHTEFQKTNLGITPNSWKLCTLAEIVESITDGPFGSSLKTEHYVEKPGVRLVRLQNICLGYFDDSDKAYISEEHASSLAKHKVVAGDLIIAALGDDKNPIARSCLYPQHLCDGIVKADCFRLRTKNHLVTHTYVMYTLNCSRTRLDIDGFKQGVTRDRVNLQNLKSFRLRLPPLEEQELITNILLQSDAQLSQLQPHRTKLEKLKFQVINSMLFCQNGSISEAGLELSN